MRNMRVWRSHIAPIIARVIREVGTHDERKLRVALRSALHDVHPNGEVPYKIYVIWQDEIQHQLHPEQFPSRRRGTHAEALRDGKQGTLFEEERR